MKTNIVRNMTDIIYNALFAASTAQLRARFGIVNDTEDDDALRDEMGIEALKILAAVERNIANALAQPKIRSSIETITTTTQEIAFAMGDFYQQECREKEIDLVTNESLENVA